MRVKLIVVSDRPRILATLEGLAVEGGFDQAGCPSTCFGPATQLGQCEATGDSENLWRDYEQVLDLVPGLGLTGVRLTLEWARLEPRPDEPDGAAFARYREVVSYAKSLGLWVTGVLVDAAWPSWLGPEAWLLPWVAPRVLAHADRVASELGDVLDGLVGLARPSALVRDGYLYASSPPWRRRAVADAASARRQIDVVNDALAAIPKIGPVFVPISSFRELPVVATEVLRDLLKNDAPVEEIHIRSLVRGVGPTASNTGLLERRNGEWRVAVDDELLDLWR